MNDDQGRDSSGEEPRAPRPAFSDAARQAAKAAKAAKRADADPFGTPEVFVVVLGARTFTWELRRFGGIVLQRSGEVFPDAASAREAGRRALKALLSVPGLPTFLKERSP